MKKVICSLVLVLLLLGIVGSAAAQGRVLARVEIPFSFNVHDQVLPAGSYDLCQLGPNGVRLRHIATSKAATLLSAQTVGTSPSITFRFRREGERYGLRLVAGEGFELKVHSTFVDTKMQARNEEISIVTRSGQ